MDRMDPLEILRCGCRYVRGRGTDSVPDFETAEEGHAWRLTFRL